MGLKLKIIPTSSYNVLAFDGSAYIDIGGAGSGHPNTVDCSHGRTMTFKMYLDTSTFEAPSGMFNFRNTPSSDSWCAFFDSSLIRINTGSIPSSKLYDINEIPVNKIFSVEIIKSYESQDTLKIDGIEISSLGAQSGVSSTNSNYIGSYTGDSHLENGSMWDIEIIETSTGTILHKWEGDGSSNSNWEDTIGSADGYPYSSWPIDTRVITGAGTGSLTRKLSIAPSSSKILDFDGSIYIQLNAVDFEDMRFDKKITFKLWLDSSVLYDNNFFLHFGSNDDPTFDYDGLSGWLDGSLFHITGFHWPDGEKFAIGNYHNQVLDCEINKTHQALDSFYINGNLQTSIGESTLTVQSGSWMVGNNNSMFLDNATIWDIKIYDTSAGGEMAHWWKGYGEDVLQDSGWVDNVGSYDAQIVPWSEWEPASRTIQGFNNSIRNKLELIGGYETTLTFSTPGTDIGDLNWDFTGTLLLTLDGEGRFYDNPTTGEGASTSKIVTAATTHVYIGCASGESTLTFSDKRLVSNIGLVSGVASGTLSWGVPVSGSTNIPILDYSNFDFPNCVQAMISTNSIFNFDLANMGESFERLTASSSGTVTGNVSNIPAACEMLQITQTNTITGDVDNINNGNLTAIRIYGQNTISGGLADLPTSLTYLNIWGQNTISGDIGDVSIIKIADTISILGNNTISGDIQGLQDVSYNSILISGDNTIYGKIDDICPSIAVLSFGGSNIIDGSIENLPGSIEEITVLGSNTIGGDITGGFSSLTRMSFGGSNTITGDVSAYKYPLIYAYTAGVNTIYGDIGDVSMGSTGQIQAYGNNTISGNIGEVMAGRVDVRGYNTISGDISDIQDMLYTLEVTGYNTITGDIATLPSTLITLEIEGSTSIYGSVDDISSTLTTLKLTGLNTIDGSLNSTVYNLSSLVYEFTIWGNNSIDGDLSFVPINCRYTNIQGDNSISVYTNGRSWPSSMTHLTHIPASGGLDSTEVDNLLIDLANKTSWGVNSVVTLTGTNAARTTASDSAVTTIEGYGVTVNTN